MTISKILKLKTKEFLNSRKNANNLLDILSYFNKEGIKFQPWILAVERIFSELIQNREMTGVAEVKVKQVSSKALSLVSLIDVLSKRNFHLWLQECYEDALKKLLAILETGEFQDQCLSLNTLMKLLALEGKYPLSPECKRSYLPHKRLKDIVSKLLSDEHDMESVIIRMSEWSSLPDVRYHVWMTILKTLKKVEMPSDIFQRNFFALLDVILPAKLINQRKDPQSTPELPLCHIEGEALFEFDEKLEVSWLDKTWKAINHWKRNEVTTHHRMLMLLLSKSLHRLTNPLPLTDLLFDSFEQGGPTSLLALQGVFVLIQKHNLEYPNIYAKLYSLFEPSIFSTKYKARLFHLANIFLSSTHLPESIVASFAKRISRLALVAPPPDIILILAFVGNLILRHPGLKKMVDHPGGGLVDSDPFLSSENDPMNTRALESSLWEIKSLQRHVLPSVSTAARFIDHPLPSVEWDIEPLLEGEIEKIFESESRKKAKEVAVTFERPRLPGQPHRIDDVFPKFWKIP